MPAGPEPDSRSRVENLQGAARDLLEGTAWMLALHGAIVSGGLVIVIFLSRALGPEGYGRYGVVLALVTGLEVAVSSVFSRTTIALLGDRSSRDPMVSSLVQLQLLIAGGVAAAVWFGAGLLATLLGDPTLDPLLRIAALDLPLWAIGGGYLQALVAAGRFRIRAVLGALRWALKLGLVVSVVVAGLDVEGAIAANVASTAALALAARLASGAPLFRRSHHPWSALAAAAGPVAVAAILMRALESLDLLAVQGLGRDPVETGLYAAVTNLARPLGLMAGALWPALMSVAARLEAQGQQAAARALSAQFLRAAALLAPFAGAAAGVAPALTSMLLGPRYAEASLWLAILIVGGGLRILANLATSVLIAAGDARAVAWTVAPATAVAVVAYGLAVPGFGALGAAATTAGITIVLTLMLLARLRVLAPEAPGPASAARVAGATVAAWAVAALLPGAGWTALVKVALVGGAGAVVMVACGEIDLRGLRRLPSLLARPASTDPATKGEER